MHYISYAKGWDIPQFLRKGKVFNEEKSHLKISGLSYILSFFYLDSIKIRIPEMSPDNELNDFACSAIIN